MYKIPQKNKPVTGLGFATQKKARIYPNGEAVVWRPKRSSAKELVTDREHELTYSDYLEWGSRECPDVLNAVGVPLGLSLLSFSDNPELAPLNDALYPPASGISSAKKMPPRYGAKGIGRGAARTVRNACFLLERRRGVGHCVFATVTLPDLPESQLALIHENWYQVVELYRLALKRELIRFGLTGESVSVMEVQEKRYERTGLPVLHIHTVFCGRTSSGQWALSTERHDEIWRNAIRAILPDLESSAFLSSCNLQPVKKSAGAYLSKYMSKGTRVVRWIVECGYSSWLPRRWWAISKNLRQEIASKTVDADDISDCLFEDAYGSCSEFWKWAKPVYIEIAPDELVVVAIYGKVHDWVCEQLRKRRE